MARKTYAEYTDFARWQIDFLMDRNGMSQEEAIAIYEESLTLPQANPIDGMAEILGVPVYEDNAPTDDGKAGVLVDNAKGADPISVVNCE